MSDEGERTCPLCAEEMDMTDQQLKPCKCGYEICVWCWHHIMDMAEKDETEGRCPACRTPYNKDKVVGTAANCKRLVAEMNVEKKMKSQKTKSKTSEGRRQLSSVRVIQRNLVYVVGLPLNLADEDLLQRREYFSQYGRVLKVSISRTAAGAIQNLANNSCSVYITYSKEEEAVRCIQSVHGFVLDGRPLRACFGTTKYCHAWLRNVPCSNPDCLYLHEIGSQEDSFSKDEIVSAFTRSRVQQITAVTNNLQERSGNVLPPPADESYINIAAASSGKPISKSSSHNPAGSAKGSPPNSSSARSVALPGAASWGTRASNSHPPSGSLSCSNGPSKQRPEACAGSVSFSTAVTGITHVPVLDDDVGKKLIPTEQGRMILHKAKQESPEPVIQYVDGYRPTTASEAPATPKLSLASTVNIQLHSPPSSEGEETCNGVVDLSETSSGHGTDEDLNVSINGSMQNISSDMASININRCCGDYGDTRLSGSLADSILVNSPQDHRLKPCSHEKLREPSSSIVLVNALPSTGDISVTREPSGLISDSLTREQFDRQIDSQIKEKDSRIGFHEVEEDLRYFEDQRLMDPEVVIHTSCFPHQSHTFQHSSHSRVNSLQQNSTYGSCSINQDPQLFENRVDKDSLQHLPGFPIVPNGFPEISSSVDLDRTVQCARVLPGEVKTQHLANVGQNFVTDMGENGIISNILSMDFDKWDEPLTSPQNWANLLGETDSRQGSRKSSSSSKVQSSSQSRFSFARQEELRNQVSGVEPFMSNTGQVLKDHPFNLGFADGRDSNFDKLGDFKGFSTYHVEESDNLASNYSYWSSNKLSVSRAQVSAPPGFSVHSKAPPPGFASHERTELTFDAMSGNHLLDASSLLRNLYQAPPTENIGGAGDIEFIDPAILAVGRGRHSGGLNNAASLDMRSNFPSQLSALENEARLQLLMQRSFFPPQNQRSAEIGDGFAPFSDTYRTPSRIIEQTQPGNLSPFSHHPLQQSRTALMSNGHWDGWNEVQSGIDLGMTELLRNKRPGFNKLYSNYEDPKYRMPSSGGLYNRSYGN